MKQTYLVFPAVLLLSVLLWGCGADMTSECSNVTGSNVCSQCGDKDAGRVCQAQKNMLTAYLSQGLDSTEQDMLCKDFRNTWYGQCAPCDTTLAAICSDCTTADTARSCQASYVAMQTELAVQRSSFNYPEVEEKGFCRGGFVSAWSETCGFSDYCIHLLKVCDYCEVTYWKDVQDTQATAELRDYCDWVVSGVLARRPDAATCRGVWDGIADQCSYETIKAFELD